MLLCRLNRGWFVHESFSQVRSGKKQNPPKRYNKRVLAKWWMKAQTNRSRQTESVGFRFSRHHDHSQRRDPKAGLAFQRMARRLARCILRLRPDERRRDSAQDVSRFFLLAHHENRPRHPERSRRVNAAWYVVRLPARRRLSLYCGRAGAHHDVSADRQNMNCIGPVRVCSSDLDSRLRGNDIVLFLLVIPSCPAFGFRS